MDFKRYCDTMRSTAAWGGQPEVRRPAPLRSRPADQHLNAVSFPCWLTTQIQALSRILQRPIHVVQATGPIVRTGDDYGPPVLHISYVPPFLPSPCHAVLIDMGTTTLQIPSARLPPGRALQQSAPRRPRNHLRLGFRHMHTLYRCSHYEGTTRDTGAEAGVRAGARAQGYGPHGDRRVATHRHRTFETARPTLPP